LVLALASLSYAGDPVTLVVTFSNTTFPSYVDTIGTGTQYTNCIDKGSSLPYAETEQPPPPPPGNTDARFTDFSGFDPSADCHGTGVKTDIHAGSTTVEVVDTFQYQIQVADKNQNWFITWDTTGIGSKFVNIHIEDALTGGLVNVDMMTTDSIKLTKTSTGKNVTQFFIYCTWQKIVPLGVIERDHNKGVPSQFALNQNYPNPFNPTTTLSFNIVKTAYTEVAVYNILGQKVSTLVGQQLSPGVYTTKWNGTDDRGMSVASGVYFVRMTADYDNAVGNFTALRKILLMK
jgi:hypothetical protein